MIPIDEIPNPDVADPSLEDIRPSFDEDAENPIHEEASDGDPYEVHTGDPSMAEAAPSSQREVWQDMSQGSIGQVMVAEAAQVIGSQLKRSLAFPWQVGTKARRLGAESITDQLRRQLRVHEVGALDVSQSEGQDPSAEVGLVERQSPFILRRLCRARVARSECDIRNLALKKLKSILLLDLEATSLGRSLTTRADQMASEEELGDGLWGEHDPRQALLLLLLPGLPLGRRKLASLQTVDIHLRLNAKLHVCQGVSVGLEDEAANAGELERRWVSLQKLPSPLEHRLIRHLRPRQRPSRRKWCTRPRRGAS